MGGILLIDAEQPFADQLAEALERVGFSIKVLDDGKDGLDFARDTRPDLIVLCVELPKMSGYSICNKLKKDPDLKGIPLIITSKEATPETFAQHKKLKTRAEDYLIKPFSEPDLIDKIGALISMPTASLPTIALPSPSAGMGPGGLGLGGLGNGAFAAPAAIPDPYDPLGGDSLPGDLDLGTAGLDAELGSLDSPSSSLGLSPEDDALLASLDDLGGDHSRTLAVDASNVNISELELASIREEEALVDSLGAGDIVAPASLAPAPAPIPPPRAGTSSSMAGVGSADVSALRRDNADMKAKVAELEVRLRSAEENLREKESALTSALASGGGGSSPPREVLNIKEQLQAKRKENQALQDELLEKEKVNVDLQEEIESIRGDIQKHANEAKSKTVEIEALTAKLNAVAEENDELVRTADLERDEARAGLEKSKATEERLRMDVDRAKVETKQLEAKVKELEAEVRTQEDRAVKAYQRLKTEETLREKAKKAAERAVTLLSGDSADGNLDQLDAE